MKIIHIITGDLWAGAEAQVFYYLKELIKEPTHSVKCILFNNGELMSRLSAIGIQVVLIDESKYSFLSQLRCLRRLLNLTKPEIVHVHDYKTQVLANLAAMFGNTKFKMIRTVHGLTVIPFNIKMIKSWIVVFAEGLFLKFMTDCIIAVSEDIEMIFKRKYPRTHISQINNAIEIPRFIPNSPELMKEKYSIPDNAFWIGTAARYVEVKNLEMLIETARIMAETNEKIEFKVSIFGDGKLKNKLTNLIARYNLTDFVQLHGHTNDILSIFNAIDVFVLTSIHEGLPISLLEAMASGAVPICTSVGGMKEVIENEKNGFLIGSNNPRELAQKIMLLYKSPDRRNLMSTNAKKRIRELYSIEMNTRKLISTYNHILRVDYGV